MSNDSDRSKVSRLRIELNYTLTQIVPWLKKEAWATTQNASTNKLIMLQRTET